MRDTFFDKTCCDKCGNELKSRKQCWFTSDVMCLDCSIAQGQFRVRMRKAGMDDLKYEGCGYIPKVEG